MRSGRIWLGVESAGDIHGILDEARECSATDVHIMAHSTILFRIDGELQPYSDEVLSASVARHLACDGGGEHFIRVGLQRSEGAHV